MDPVAGSSLPCNSAAGRCALLLLVFGMVTGLFSRLCQHLGLYSVRSKGQCLQKLFSRNLSDRREPTYVSGVAARPWARGVALKRTGNN